MSLSVKISHAQDQPDWQIYQPVPDQRCGLRPADPVALEQLPGQPHGAPSVAVPDGKQIRTDCYQETLYLKRRTFQPSLPAFQGAG